MRQIRPDEIIKTVDSILEEEYVEEKKENFFSHEDYSWSEELMKALEKRVTPSLLIDSLVEARDKMLTSTKDPRIFFTTVSKCRKCTTAVSEPIVFEGIRQESKIAFVLPYYSPSISAKLKGLVSSELQPNILSFHYLIKCVLETKSTDEELKNCGGYIFSELQFFNPRAIILLGKQAAKHFFPSIDSIENWRGKIHYLSNYSFIVSSHPEDPNLENESGLKRWQADLELAKTLL